MQGRVKLYHQNDILDLCSFLYRVIIVLKMLSLESIVAGSRFNYGCLKL